MKDDVPQQAPHFFTEVDMGLFPELDYRSFEEISQLARANGSIDAYDGLREAVRKFSWMILAARQLVRISRYLASQESGHKEGKIYSDFSAHSDYERNLTEFAGYGKSTLDSLAYYLNNFFDLKEKNQGADFKWAKFRDSVKNVVPGSAEFFESNADWLDKDAVTTASVFATRDEWVHRGAPVIWRHFPAQSFGPLPIPLALKKETQQAPEEIKIWSIEAFTEHHLSRLHQLMRIIVRTAISIEREKSPDLAIDRMSGPSTFFPVRITEGMTLKSMAMRIP